MDRLLKNVKLCLWLIWSAKHRLDLREAVDPDLVKDRDTDVTFIDEPPIVACLDCCFASTDGNESNSGL